MLVATDDERIAEAAEGFGARVSMTSPDHVSGTDRIAEAVASESDCTHVINIQGDEPLIDPELIDTLVEQMADSAEIPMITAAVPAKPGEDFQNPNIVKVVLNKRGEALYFSRSVIPHTQPESPGAPHYRHKGIYGYTKEFLLQFVRWAPSPLELAERLEQLRALENGAMIRVVLTDDDSIGVDTPEQADQIEQLLLANNRSRSEH